MNKVVITGRITKDIELRKTKNNKIVAEIYVACNRDFKDQEGNYITDFIKTYVWENEANFLSKYAKKGSLIAVAGKIETNTYVKNDQKVYSTYINAEHVEILSNPKSERQDFEEKPNNNVIIEQEELPFY